MYLSNKFVATVILQLIQNKENSKHVEDLIYPNNFQFCYYIILCQCHSRFETKKKLSLMYNNMNMVRIFYIMNIIIIQKVPQHDKRDYFLVWHQYKILL